MRAATVFGLGVITEDHGVAEAVEGLKIEIGLGGSRQLLQQGFRPAQVRRCETFGEAAVDRAQQSARRRGTMPIEPQPRETGRRPQLPEKRILALCHVEGAPEMLLGDSRSISRALQ